MSMKALLSLLLVVVYLMPSVAWAQNTVRPDPPIQTIPPGDDKIVALQRGEAAPYTGQLFDPNTAMRWGFWLQQWQARYSSDVFTEREICTAKLEYKDGVIAAEKDRATRVERDLQLRLQRSEQARVQAEYELAHPGFFDSPTFYYALGVVTTGALLGLSVWAVDSAK
jgi:hypothetical protein